MAKCWSAQRGATQIKDKQVVDWFVQSAAAKVFTLTATKPRVTKETTRKIVAGDAISETLFNGSKSTRGWCAREP